MNSSFKVEDASQGSPFGFDTTLLQDDPVELKATEGLKKSSKSKRHFESRLLVDPYLLSRQVENGKLSATVRKLLVEPYTIVFTSEDYDSDEPNVGVTSPEKIVKKIENRAKASTLAVNHAERTYEPPNKKKKIVSKEPPDVLIHSAENSVAKDTAARLGNQTAVGIMQETNTKVPKPAVSVCPKTQQQNEKTAASTTVEIGPPRAEAMPFIQNNAQKVQVRLPDGRILLMSLDLYLKLRKSGPSNNTSLIPVEQNHLKQQSKPVATNSTPMISSGSTPSGSTVRPYCVLGNSEKTAQKQNAPGPRLILQQRPEASNVKQMMTPVASASSGSQIEIVAARGGSNPRIIINPGSSLANQLSKIQLQQTNSKPATPTAGPVTQQPLRIVTTQPIVPRHPFVVSNPGAMVQQRPTYYNVTSRVGPGQLRLPIGAQNKHVRVCLIPAPRNATGASQTQNYIVVNTPGNIR